MGARGLIGFAFAVGLAACGGRASQAPTTGGVVAPGGNANAGSASASPTSLPERVAADFEAAVRTSKNAYVSLFDFSAVGEFEILLHRYDLNGRLVHLPDDQKQQFLREDGTPYPASRERRNVGNFYKILAQRTVGTGGCTAHPPRTHYGKLLGQPFDPLPPSSEVEIGGEHESAPTPPGYQILRDHANAWLSKGGVVGLVCTGGKGGLAIVYTQRDNARGYDLITIYDD